MAEYGSLSDKDEQSKTNASSSSQEDSSLRDDIAFLKNLLIQQQEHMRKTEEQVATLTSQISILNQQVEKNTLENKQVEKTDLLSIPTFISEPNISNEKPSYSESVTSSEDVIDPFGPVESSLVHRNYRDGWSRRYFPKEEAKPLYAPPACQFSDSLREIKDEFYHAGFGNLMGVAGNIMCKILEDKPEFSILTNTARHFLTQPPDEYDQRPKSNRSAIESTFDFVINGLKNVSERLIEEESEENEDEDRFSLTNHERQPMYNYKDFIEKRTASIEEDNVDNDAGDTFSCYHDAEDAFSEENFYECGSVIEEKKFEGFSGKVSCDTIQRLSEIISCADCRKLCRILHLTDVDIDDVEKDNINFGFQEIRYKLLLKWTHKEAYVATEENLIKSLFCLRRADLVKILFPGFQVWDEEFFPLMPPISLTDERALTILRKLQIFFKQHYRNISLPSTPWMEKKNLSIEELYIDLMMYTKNKHGTEDCAKEINISDVFENVHGEEPRRILVEAPPGYGKTTFASKIAYAWATNADDLKEKFDLVFFVFLRHLNDSLESVLVNECNVEGIEDNEKLAVIKQYEKRILLILDGYDELTDEKKTYVTSLIKGEKYPEMTILVTSRTGHFKLITKRVNKDFAGFIQLNSKFEDRLAYCNKRIEIKGVSPEKRKIFLQKYLGADAEDFHSRLSQVMNEEIIQLYECPLVVVLLAMLMEDKKMENITTKTRLYQEVFNFIIRRSLVRESYIKSTDEIDLFSIRNRSFYVELLCKFGKFALDALRSNTLTFSEADILNCCPDSRILKFGFLTKNIRFSRHERSEHFEPVHKTFLEFLAAYFLWMSMKSTEGLQKSEMFDFLKKEIFQNEYSLLFVFLSGLLGDDVRILLKALTPIGFAMSAFESPLNEIVEEAQGSAKVYQYLMPFSRSVYIHRTSVRETEFEKNLIMYGMHVYHWKIISFDIHDLLFNSFQNIECDLLQLDIRKKHVTDLSLNRTPMNIVCNRLVCWFHGIEKECWNYYAKVIQRIRTQEFIVIVNGYEDFNQVPEILSIIFHELRDGLWSNKQISMLKVKGIDGNSDRKSLSLINDFVQSGMISNGLAVDIRSIISSLHTLLFWFKTDYMKSFDATVMRFLNFLRNMAVYHVSLANECTETVRFTSAEIHSVKAKLVGFMRLIQNIKGSDIVENEYDEDILGANFKIKHTLAEEKCILFAQNLDRNLREFLNDLAMLFDSVEKNLSLLSGFRSQLKKRNQALNDYFENVNQWFETEDPVGGVLANTANSVLKSSNSFHQELKVVLSAITKSNFVKNVSIKNGYVTMFRAKCPAFQSYENRIKNWNSIHVEGFLKLKIHSSLNIKHLNFGFDRLGCELRNANRDAILRCLGLSGLTISTELLDTILEEENWSGFESLVELYWYLLDDFDLSEMQMLKLTRFVKLKKLVFHCLSLENNLPKCGQVLTSLPWHCLKTIEIRELENSNLIFLTEFVNLLLIAKEERKEIESSKGERMKSDIVLNKLTVEIPKTLDMETLQLTLKSVIDLMCKRIVNNICLIEPDDVQLMELGKLNYQFNYKWDIDEADSTDPFLFYQNKKSGSDVTLQLVLCLQN